MKHLLLVFLGGGLGSALRFIVGKQFTTISATQFPWGTFIVNLIGSLIIGLVFGYILVKHKLSDETFFFIVAGFCGGFTTFSAYAHESLVLLKNGQTSMFFTYAIGSLLAGLFCVWLGYMISAQLN